MSVQRVFAARLALVIVLCALLSAPRATNVASAPVAQGTSVTVFAASSLTDVFKDMGALFEANTGVPVTFNFGASTQLRTQLEQGAQADVFASADQAQMDRAKQSGVIATQDMTFATNRLVLITPASNPARITGPADLAVPGIKLVTAQEDVPIGVYTQNMLDSMSKDPQFGADFKDRANANIVSREANVRQIVAKIQLGEGDAAVVYRTDVTPQAAPDLATFDISDAFNTLASYPIALVAGAPQAELGYAFVGLVLSGEGQAVLQKWNFLPAPSMALAPVPQSAVAH